MPESSASPNSNAPAKPSEMMALAYKALKDRHYHEAARLFELAALAGLMDAQYELGQLFEKGMGVRTDATRARKLYEKAAKQNHILAVEKMAYFVAEGIGGDKLPDQAKEWQDKAQNLKDEKAKAN